jgi:HTH-type transcriptional regulator / antitoxin HigA
VRARLRQAEIDGLQSQIDDLRRELNAYEKLKTGNVTVLRHTGLSSIAHSLIRARIAEGLKQEDLAARLGVKAQQVQRYEATEYQTASLARLHQVADVLGLTWEHIVTRRKTGKIRTRSRGPQPSEVK